MTQSVTNVMQRLVHTLVLLSGTVRPKKGFMDATIYQDGTYLTNNPGWHADLAARWLGGYSLLVLAE